MQRHIRLIMIFFFVVCSSNLHAQCNGTYKVSSTYDSNNNKCKLDMSIPKILVTSSNYFGIRQASITTYNPMINMWNTSFMSFNYYGYGNGWYIYRCDVFMMGTNFLYLHRNGTKVRLKYSFNNGIYSEFEKHRDEDDLEKNLTW